MIGEADIERLVAVYRGQTRRLEGPPVIKDLEPGRAEIAAAEAAKRPD